MAEAFGVSFPECFYSKNALSEESGQFV